MSRTARSKGQPSEDRKSGAIEVLELEQPSSAHEEGARRGGRWIALFGLAIAIALGVSLLPNPAPPPPAVEDTLPTPGVATTLANRETVIVGILGDDTFPIQFESSLNGYRSLAGPALHEGSWWMVGNRDQAALLASSGTSWEEVGQFPFDEGRFVEIVDLIESDGAMVAVGYEGYRTEGRDQIERLQVWRSSDGLTWIPEEVTTGGTFFNTRIVANGHNLVVTTNDATQDRLFHSSSFTRWEEVPITFSTDNQIVQAPEGGFLLSTGQGAALTSAYGGIWSRNHSIERGFYTQWENRVVGVYTRSGTTTMTVLGTEERLTVQLPDELEGCRIEGGVPGLIAICPNQSSWGYHLLLSRDGLIWEKSEAALMTDSLEYEGFTDHGFLVSIAGRDGFVVARADLS